MNWGCGTNSIFSTSAGWSRRTTACWCAKRLRKVETTRKLALIGDAPYAPEYIEKVRDTTDPRIVMPGAIYGDGYKELGSHCFAVYSRDGSWPARIRR